MSRRARRGVASRAVPVIAAAAVALTACSDEPDALERYTDPGDGCQQAVSAIAYADDVLVPLGQEDFQDFDDAVRSRIAAVAGTVALEGRDWPTEDVATQAGRLQAAADRAQAREFAGRATPAAAAALLDYRIEASVLVRLCRTATATVSPG